MKKTAFTFLLSLVWSLGFSQYLVPTKIDSLKHELSIATLDTSRVLAMIELANAYLSFRLDSSFQYAQQALMLSRKIKFPKGEFHALYWMGFTLGLVGNYPRALEIHLKALRIAEKHNYLNGKADIFKEFGVFYQYAGDYSKAVVFHQRSRLLNDSLQNHEQSAGMRNMLATDYLLMNKTDSAQYYAQLAYEATNRWKVEWLRTGNYEILGRLQSELGNFPLALDYLQKSAHYADVRQQYVNSPRAYLLIAKVYQQTNQLDSCVFYAQKALADAQKGNIYNEIVNASLFLSALYEQKNAQLALQYQKTALAAKDSRYNFGNLTAIQNQVAFDEEERQYEIETAQTALRSQVWRNTLLAGLGVFLLISFMLYRNYQKEKKVKNLLHKEKEKVESTLTQLKSTQAQLIQAEKLASLGELTAGIAHEIQNPLNFVNNFSEVSGEMLGEMKEEIKAGNTAEVIAIADNLEQNLQKINHHGQRASSIVKGMLEHSRTSTGVKEPTDLNALADEYLRLAYHGQRAKDDQFNCRLETHFDPDLPIVSVIPQDIGRVLLNLINNAFYAVAEKTKQGMEGYEPTVIISSRKLENAIEICVQDNGKGIPEVIRKKIFQPFFTTKQTGQGTGLGLSLAYDIVVKAHSGTLKVESKEDEGTEFIISIPVLSFSP